jgi:hypothetical protein
LVLLSCLQESVINTIVARVQGVPGDDRCVLMLGYTEQMEVSPAEVMAVLDHRSQPTVWHVGFCPETADTSAMTLHRRMILHSTVSTALPMHVMCRQ